MNADGHDAARVLYGVPSNVTKLLMDTLTALFIRPPSEFAGKKVTARRRAAHEARVVEFRTVANGNPCAPTSSHTCHADVGCGCSSDRKVTQRRYAAAIVSVGYKRMPTIPQLKEWTAVSQSLDNLALVMNINEIGIKAFEHSVTRLTPQALAAARRTHDTTGLALVPAADLGG